jgi:hypothetical protein
MTLFQFKQLENNEQGEVTWQKGVHLSTRFSGLHAILLWQIDSFYVEIFYNRIDDKIERLRSFRSTIPLGPYLNQIDINAVLP